MPIITINPGRRKDRTHAADVGSRLYGYIGNFVGSGIDALFARKKAYPFEVDTETGKVDLLTSRDYLKLKFPAGYARATRKDAALEALIQSAWSTGAAPPGLPGRYRSAVQELIAQKALFPPSAVAPEPFTQYGDSMITIPPGGFAGFNNMSPASKLALKFPGMGGRSSGKRRRKSKKASSGKRRKKAARKSGGRKRAKLVKGSAAAKRFMANLRKKRG